MKMNLRLSGKRRAGSLPSPAIVKTVLGLRSSSSATWALVRVGLYASRIASYPSFFPLIGQILPLFRLFYFGEDNFVKNYISADDISFVKAFLKRINRSRRNSSERGASLVEFALVAPLFFLLVFGMIEGAALFFARNTLGLAASDAVREAALASDATDDEILDAIRRGADNAFGSSVDSVIIYKAIDNDARPTDACLDGNNTADCQVYTSADLAATTVNCVGGWCDRNNADGGIGIWIQADYDGLTGLNPFPISWNVQKFALIEPGIGGTS